MIEYLPLVLTGIDIIISILYYTSVLRNRARALTKKKPLNYSLISIKPLNLGMG